MPPASPGQRFETVQLTQGSARLTVVPGLGGGIAELSAGGRPVLRPYLKPDVPHPFELASIVLTPFSNRIAGGAFEWNGAVHRIAPNVEGEPFPIHGDGFQREWTVSGQSASSLSLRLEDGQSGPFRYAAEQSLHLTETACELTLSVTNTGDDALPFGLGFHPWFPRSPQTRLQFSAGGVWLNDAQTLPVRHIGLSDMPDWDFRSASPLPPRLIDNAFTGWNGAALIHQGTDHVSVRIRASPILSAALVYSPGETADFFCFEPVSHPINAHNLSGHPGLVVLAPGDQARAKLSLDWDAT